MRTKLISLLLSMVMLLSLCATAAYAEAQPVTITYACWDSNQAALLQTVADEFHAANPNITIDIQVNGWSDYWTALEAAATGGSLPDTFWMHSNNIYYYGANNQLMDLSDYIAKSDLVDLNNFPEGLNAIYNIDGKQYAVPKDYDTIALWYNKTLFDAAGINYPDDTWTWDDLRAAAKALTKADGSQYGFCAGQIHSNRGSSTVHGAGDRDWCEPQRGSGSSGIRSRNG